MSNSTTENESTSLSASPAGGAAPKSEPRHFLARVRKFRPYYGWVIVVVAALAMVATLPGRTHGLGMCTQSLLKEFELDEITFGHMNFWATILGALFCIPTGQMLDRFGTRVTLAAVALLLGLTVWQLSHVQTVTMLFVLILLTRGFGQSALSVVSISMIGKWFGRRIRIAMSVYSVLVGLSFGLAFKLVGTSIRQNGWRYAWWEISMALMIGLVPIALLLVRSTPESCGVKPDDPADDAVSDATGLSLIEALWTPAFWVFALSPSLFGLVSSGIGLFNESILKDRGFDIEAYHKTLELGSYAGLAGQACYAFIGRFLSVRRVMSLAMLIYAGSLFWLPNIATMDGIRIYAVVMGTAGGLITVVFFAVWVEAFGRVQLGRIQGAAQMMTVLASAVGPIVFATSKVQLGSYSPAFYSLAAVVLLLGVIAWIVPMPNRKPQRVLDTGS